MDIPQAMPRRQSYAWILPPSVFLRSEAAAVPGHPGQGRTKRVHRTGYGWQNRGEVANDCRECRPLPSSMVAGIPRACRLKPQTSDMRDAPSRPATMMSYTMLYIPS